MNDQGGSVRITRVQLTNFKGFPKYSLALESMTILVGPNNVGKSTIVGAFRALSVALRTARRLKSDILQREEGSQYGYRIPSEGIPISLENAQHNYSDREAVAEFMLSNGRTLSLVFSPDRSISLFVDYDGPRVRSVADFRRHFPIEVGIVPVLGPVEHEEQLVEEGTVQRNLQTHRASRNFRNYWHYSSDDQFEEFRQAIGNSWHGIDIQKPRPRLGGDTPQVLDMMCAEERIPRELYWMGFGFQIWLQIITHVLRAHKATILVLDEPETYLHPALQRHLINVLRGAGADCLLATHSSEIVGEAERSEIVLVDKGLRSGKRLGTDGHTDALDALGSRFNFALTDVLRQRKAILLEGGSDLKCLKLLGSRLSPPRLTGIRVPPLIPLGGHRPDEAANIAQAMKTLVGPDVQIAIVLDRDYRSDEEVADLESGLKEKFPVAHVLRRKEIENYFLAPGVIERVLGSRDSGGQEGADLDIAALLLSITDSLLRETQSQCVAKHFAYVAKVRPWLDSATSNKEALERFDRRWETLEGRLDVVSGKEVFRMLNAALQENGNRAITMPQLAKQMRAGDIPREITMLLLQLDQLIAPDV